MEKFETYDAIQLAQNQSFIRWVKQSDAEAIQFWENWQIMHPEMAPTVKEAKAIVLSIQFRERSLANKEVDDLWAKIVDNTDAKTIQIKDKRLLRPWAMVAAASVLCLLVVYFLFYESDQVMLVADNSQWPSYMLPDSSMAELNAGSQLSYSESGFKEAKVVELKGEALFKIEKKGSFTINTKLGKVEVLGTTFNVYSRANYFNVKCFEGSVKVTLANGKEDTLIANQAIIFQLNEEGKKITLDSTATNDWREGFFTFDQVPYEVIFKELERQFDIKISADQSIRNQIVNGFFTNDDLDTALQYVCGLSGLSFEATGKNRYRIFK